MSKKHWATLRSRELRVASVLAAAPSPRRSGIGKEEAARRVARIEQDAASTMAQAEQQAASGVAHGVRALASALILGLGAAMLGAWGIPLATIPDVVQKAFVAAEDRRFFQHHDATPPARVSCAVSIQRR